MRARWAEKFKDIAEQVDGLHEWVRYSLRHQQDTVRRGTPEFAQLLIIVSQLHDIVQDMAWEKDEALSER